MSTWWRPLVASVCVVGGTAAHAPAPDAASSVAPTSSAHALTSASVTSQRASTAASLPSPSAPPELPREVPSEPPRSPIAEPGASECKALFDLIEAAQPTTVAVPDASDRKAMTAHVVALDAYAKKLGALELSDPVLKDGRSALRHTIERTAKLYRGAGTSFDEAEGRALAGEDDGRDVTVIVLDIHCHVRRLEHRSP